MTTIKVPLWLELTEDERAPDNTENCQLHLHFSKHANSSFFDMKKFEGHEAADPAYCSVWREFLRKLNMCAPDTPDWQLDMVIHMPEHY